MVNRLGHYAVVIGGSLAGLMTARVLADYFDQVTVLERDPIEDRPAVHRSVPQGNHLHALLLGGQQVMSSLYPGFTEQLHQMGAVRFRAGQDAVFYFPHGKAYNLTGTVMQPHGLGFDVYGQSRGLLEHCVRQFTRALPKVALKSATLVQELIYESARVQGVRYSSPVGADSLAADLVVDAGGRGSHAPRWLRELGFPAPRETIIGVDFAYSSAKFRMPDSYNEPERVVGVLGPPPTYLKAAIMEEIEDRTWHLSLGGRFGEYPPEDEDGFLAFVRSLHSSRLYELIKDAQRVTDIFHYRFPTSVLRHYEGLSAFPERFLVLGDAISSFNPIYGQGMSSAALQVQALQRLLTERAAGPPGLEGLASAFFPRVAEVVAAPWGLASSSDFAFPQTTGQRPPTMDESGRYLMALDLLAAEDVEVYQLVAEVFQLARPLSALIEEPIRRRVEERLRMQAS